MTATAETGVECKPLSIQEQLDIINRWMILQMFLAKKKSLKNLEFVYKLEIHDTILNHQVNSYARKR
jgi:hypothetical protein